MADDDDGWMYVIVSFFFLFFMGFMVEMEDGGTLWGNVFAELWDVIVYFWLATWWCWTGLFVILGLLIAIMYLTLKPEYGYPQTTSYLSPTVPEKGNQSMTNVDEVALRVARKKMAELFEDYERENNQKPIAAKKQDIWEECYHCGAMYKDTPGKSINCCHQCYHEISGAVADYGEGY